MALTYVPATGRGTRAMTLSTGSVAAGCARHPWRTIGAWIVLTVFAVVSIATLLGGSLTTEGSPTNNPESERAEDARLAAFQGRRNVGHRHRRHPLRAVHRRLDTVQRLRAASQGRRLHLRARHDAHLPRRLGYESRLEDRHATIVPVALSDDDETEALVTRSRRSTRRLRGVGHGRGDARPRLQSPLARGLNGELKFGLPAALIIPLLVFGAVVAGRCRC